MTSATEKKLLILGAGPTGLGAGWRLAQRGHANWAIRERNAYPGGLSASFLDAQGFTWDIGGHVVFSHYPEFDRFFDEMTGGDVFRHERRSYIRLAGAWIPYPFQNNIHRLPPNLRQECLDGLEQVAGANRTPQIFWRGT
jgi:UDP-galactopyranose mutase